jgi:1,4-alpha-glucan branching enzyme
VLDELDARSRAGGGFGLVPRSLSARNPEFLERIKRPMARQAAILKPQTFQLNAPEANKVLLAGDFTEWQKKAIPMQKNGDGLWTITVKLAPGDYNYLFMVDGQWCEDPECPLRVPNPYGGKNMVRQVV